jgi:hypothetical protein
MKKNRLKNLAREKRFIPGIYNYCDRWCERCPQTSHCLNFAMAEEEFADPQARDIRNEAFWNKLSEVYQDTIELLKEAAREHGIDLDALDTTGQTEEESRLEEEMAKSHPICRAAKVYSNRVEDWFESEPRVYAKSPALDRGGMGLEEALEVIRWYQHFIYVKLMRAVRGDLEEREEGLDEYARDSDGSAKIALIGIDRSIGAWGVVRAHAPLVDEKILHLIAHLDHLREDVEKAFPEARGFIRPGFDSPGLQS